MSMSRILIVEDEPDLAFSLEEDLRRQGHQPQVAIDGEQGLAIALGGEWDLVLLDVMLPKLDGFEVCSELRRRGVSTPVIMLTARSQEAEKILGLDSGADDYVTKPFSLRELRARIRAHLRRGGPTARGSFSSATASSISSGPSSGKLASRSRSPRKNSGCWRCFSGTGAGRSRATA